MVNNILCGVKDLTVGDSFLYSLIGISVVFMLLLLLIGVAVGLKHLNKVLELWDVWMAVVRGNRAEVIALKKSYTDMRDEQIDTAYIQSSNGEITADEAKATVADIKADFNTNIRPVRDLAVSELKAKLKAERKGRHWFTFGGKPCADICQCERNCGICQCDNLASGEVVIDARLIAVITAAIAVVTEQEGEERKVKFKVRSIKHIN